MSDTASHQFGNISLGARGAASTGQFKISANGLTWRKADGGKTVNLQKKDIEGLTWTKVQRGCALGVRRRQGSNLSFIGFRDQDLTALRSIATSSFEKEIKEEQLAVSGRNWGDAVIDNSSLLFKVDRKPAFTIALPDVSQVQQLRDEVMLEFFTDQAGDREDALMEMSFFVPRDNERYAGDEETPASKVLLDALNQHTVDAGAGVDAVASFDGVAVLAPRGRFEVEMYLSFLKLVGQNQDYRIQYEAIQRIFVLPKNNSPHTLLVIAVDPPVRKGQTHYSHVLCQFPTDDDVSVELQITPEQLAQKNDQCKGKLSSTTMSGPAFDVFAKVLRGLSGARLTRPGQFRSSDSSSAVRCSYKADDGYLYPLEKAFFYIHKPPMLLLHEDIDTVEFARQDGAMAASTKTFDLVIRYRNGQEFQFRGIQKGEWQTLFDFISAKGLRIENLEETERGPGGTARAAINLDLGEDVDHGLARMASDSEDESFDAGSDEGEDDESEGEDDVAEGAEPAEKKPKKEKKRAAEEPITPDGGESPAPKPKKSKKTKLAAAEGGEDGGSGKKQRKKGTKKDKNAPKKALSAFMYFSNAKRNQIKEENPGIPFGEVGKKLGEAWKATAPEDRTQYDEQAAQDKERYAKEMVAYKQKLAAEGGGSPAGADVKEEDDEAEDAKPALEPMNLDD